MNYKLVIVILIAVLPAKIHKSYGQGTAFTDKTQSIGCVNNVQFGDVRICLPKIYGLAERYSNPMVKRRFDRANKSLMILACYFNSSIDPSTMDEDTFNSIGLSENVLIYSHEKLKGVNASPLVLNNSADEIEKNLYYKGENWDSVLRKMVKLPDSISVSKPILIESYSPLRDFRSFVILMKLESSFEEIVQVAINNMMIINDRMINMVYTADYDGLESIKKLKAKNDFILYQLVDDNRGNSRSPTEHAQRKSSNEDTIAYIKFYLTGTTKLEARDYKSAIHNFTEAIKLNPSCFEAYLNRGSARLELQEFAAAENDYKAAISLKPLFFEAHYNLGNLKQLTNDINGAISHYTNAIKIKNSYDSAYVNRGNAKAALNDYAGAIEDFSVVIKRNPNFPDIYYNRAIAKRNLNDFNGAISDYTKAIQIKPNDPKVYYNRGISKRNINDLTGAIADYNTAIKLKPGYSKAYFNRAFVKSMLKDKKGMCDDYRKSCENGYEEGCKALIRFCN